MVRIKHRYLLVNILYPEAQPSEKLLSSSSSPQTAATLATGTSVGTSLPPVVDFHKPSPASLTAGQLVRHVREHVALLYGDYGAGMTANGLASTIRKSEEEAIRRARADILKAQRQAQQNGRSAAPTLNDLLGVDQTNVVVERDVEMVDDDSEESDDEELDGSDESDHEQDNGHFESQSSL